MFPRGVTTLEIVIAIGVLAMIFGITASGLGNVERTTANLAGDRDIASALTTAARRARMGSGATPWGVYLSFDETTRLATSLVVFAGTSYATRDASKDLVLTINEDVRFTNVNWSGNAPDTSNSHEIIFQPFSGTTTGYGSVTVEWFGETSSIATAANGFPAIQ